MIRQPYPDSRLEFEPAHPTTHLIPRAGVNMQQNNEKTDRYESTRGKSTLLYILSAPFKPDAKSKSSSNLLHCKIGGGGLYRMKFKDKLIRLRNDHQGAAVTDKVIELVITVVIAAVLYAAILSTYLADLQDPNSTMYAGSTAAPIVGIITVFYWLGVALLAVGMIHYGKE